MKQQPSVPTAEVRQTSGSNSCCACVREHGACGRAPHAKRARTPKIKSPSKYRERKQQDKRKAIGTAVEVTAKQPEHEGGAPCSERASGTSHQRSEVLSTGMYWTEAMDSTDVQMARAVAVVGTSGYCGLPRQQAKRKPQRERQGYY